MNDPCPRCGCSEHHIPGVPPDEVGDPGAAAACEHCDGDRPPCTPAFRAGDKVHHGPTGETWTLSCDQYLDRVIPMGWPETLASAAECTLIEAATDQKRLEILRQVASPERDQYRCRLASVQLIGLDRNYARGLHSPELDAIGARIHRDLLRVRQLRERHGHDFLRDREHGELLDALDTACDAFLPIRNALRALTRKCGR